MPTQSRWDRLFDQATGIAPEGDAEWERRGIFLISRKTGEKKLAIPKGAEPGLGKPEDPLAGKHPHAIVGEQILSRVVEGARALSDVPLAVQRAVRGLDVASAREGERLRTGRAALPFSRPSEALPAVARAAAAPPPTPAEQGQQLLRQPYLRAKDDLAQSLAARGVSPLASAAADTALEGAAIALDPTNAIPAGKAGAAAGRALRRGSQEALEGAGREAVEEATTKSGRAVATPRTGILERAERALSRLDTAGPYVSDDLRAFIESKGFDPDHLRGTELVELRKAYRVARYPEEARFTRVSPALARPGEAGFVNTEPLRSFDRWWRENLLTGGRYRTAADDFSGQAKDFVRAIPKRKERMEAAYLADMYKKDLVLKDLEQAAKKVAPSRAARRDLYREMHQAAVGEIPIDQLPPEVQPFVARGSALVDDLSDAMVREGAIPEPLREVVAANRGKYRHRAYQAFDDPTWGRRVEAGEVEGGMQRWSDAKAWLSSELPDAPEEEILGLMRQIADRPQGAEALALYNGSPSKINDVLKQRQSIPAPIRQLMGEYDDFRVSLDKTVHNLAWDLETHKMMRDLAGEGEQLGVFRPEGAAPSGNLYQPVPGSDAVSGMTARSPLAGRLTTPGLRRALATDLELAKATWWQKLSGWTKAGKIVQNPAGIARNFLAHTLTTTANGRVPLDPRLHAKTIKALRDPLLHEEAIRANVLGQGFAAREVDQYIAWIEGESPLARGYNAVNRVFAKGFHGGDDYWKLYNWIGETEDQMWARGIPRDEAAKIAADRVSDSFPTYSRAPQITQKIRATPVLGSPGATFGIESVRVLKNNAKFALQDIAEGLKTGNQRLVALGTKRATGMIVGAAGVGAVAMRSRQENGMSLEQADALRRQVLPRYHENSELVITGFEPGKSVSYVDLSFLNPFNAVSKPLLAALRDSREGEVPVDAVVAVLENVLGGDIAAVGAFETLSGQRVESFYPPQAGGETFSWDEPGREIAKKMGYEGFQNFAPGYLVQGERLLRGAGVLPSQLDSGREFKLGQEAVAIAGVRQSTYDIPRRLRSAFYDSNQRLTDAKKRVRRAEKVGGLEPDEIEVFLDDWDASYEELRRTVEDARLLGLSRSEVLRIGDQVGAAPVAIEAALNGRAWAPVPLWKPGSPEEMRAYQAMREAYFRRRRERFPDAGGER